MEIRKIDNKPDFFDGEEDLDLYRNQNDKTIEVVSEMSANDAFVYCMNTKACVNLEYMASISGVDEDELIDELQGTIFPDPQEYENAGNYYDCFTTSHQYLRGNLVAKYDMAKKINAKYGIFDDTVRLLAEHVPEAVEPEGIHINLGATWIPVKYIIAFVQYLLETLSPPRIEYSEFLGKWTVEFPTEPNYVKNYYEFGTIRMNAAMIIKHALNAKAVRVYDQIPRIGIDELY